MTCTLSNGSIKQILIGKETTFGTKASTFFELPVKDFNLNPKVTYRKDDSAIGRIEAFNRSQISQKWSEPTIQGILGSETIGLFLEGVFGQLTTGSALETTVYPHTLEVLNSNCHPSYTIIEIDAKGIQMATGCVLNTFEITSDEDFVQFSANFIGKTPEATTATPNWAEESSFVPKDRVFKLATNVAGLPGATSIALEQCRLSFNKNAEAYFGGLEEPQAIINKRLTIEGDLTSAYSSVDLRTVFEDGTKQALLLEFENNDVLIGTTLHPKFSFTLERVLLEDWSKDSPNDDIEKQTMGFTAEYVMSSGKAISGEVQNLTSSY